MGYTPGFNQQYYPNYMTPQYPPAQAADGSVTSFHNQGPKNQKQGSPQTGQRKDKGGKKDHKQGEKKYVSKNSPQKASQPKE